MDTKYYKILSIIKTLILKFEKMACLTNYYLSTEQLLEELEDNEEGYSHALIFKGKECSEKELNAKLSSNHTTKTKKLPKKLKSVAKRQILIAEGREREKRQYWAMLWNEYFIQKSKGFNTEYVNSETDEFGYWETIKCSDYFQKLFEDGIKQSCSEGGTNAEQETLCVLRREIHCIIPNNVNIKSFRQLQNICGWEYQRNLKQESKCLPHRWCGNKANFFEPLVTRFKRDESGRKTNISGLCPYCPLSYLDECNGYDDFFFSLNSLAYETHLAYYHGVYHTGEEVSPPVFFRKRKDNMLFCHDCKRTRRIYINSYTAGDVYLLEYFEHCSHYHPRRNLIKSKRTQYLLKGQQVERIV